MRLIVQMTGKWKLGTLTYIIALGPIRWMDFCCNFSVTPPPHTHTHKRKTVLQANLSPRDNPRIVRVNEHQPIALNCGTFFSVPPIVPARIAWEVHVPGSNLPLQNNEIKSFNGSLIIQDPTVSRHNDKLYECSYDSRVGLPDEEGYVRLFVESAPSSAPPSPPHFIRVPEDVTVNVGEGAYFECIVGGT